MKLNQGSRRGRPFWLTILVGVSFWLSVNASVVPAGSIEGNSVELNKTGQQDRRKVKGKTSKDAVSPKSTGQGLGTTRTSSRRERKRQHSRGSHVSSRTANTCRCEYPNEGIYAQRALKVTSAKSQPKTGRVSSRTSTSYTVVNGVTVLPPTFLACRGVVYVCADTYFNGPIWNYDCSGNGITDFVGYVVVIPNNYFLCQCQISGSGSQFDLVPGGGTSSPTISPTVAGSVAAKTPKAKSGKRAGGIFASNGAERLFSDKAGKRQLSSHGSFGNHRVLKGDKGAAKDAAKGARASGAADAKVSVYTPSPTVISRFYPPIRCSAPRPSSASVSPTTFTFMPTSSAAPSLTTNQPTTHIITITETPSVFPTLSAEPSMYPTAMATPTLSPTASVVPTVATGTPTAHVVAVPAPTKRPTLQPVPAPHCPPATMQPSKTPSTMPSHMPSVQATQSPTTHVIAAPTLHPTGRPTLSSSPSEGPSHRYVHPGEGVPDRPQYNMTPGVYITKAPSPMPTASPTMSPTTLSPTTSPTTKVIPVTALPSVSPSFLPTVRPVTLSPTYYPTVAVTPPPTPPPTQYPTVKKTPAPTPAPTDYPTTMTPAPTPSPTDYPTAMTPAPTTSPTVRVIPATVSPTNLPTPYPTPSPTKFPTPRPTFATGKPSASPSRDEDIPSGTWFPTLDFYDVNERLTCIAVVDDIHVSADVISSNWTKFRKDYPLRSFCLIQPGPDQKSELGIPAAFKADAKASFFRVNRDYGVAAAAADWFEICGLSSLKSEGITKVAFAIDTPQLYSATYVRAAYELFLNKIAAERVSLLQAPVGPDENWISPFLQTFL